MDSQRRPVGEAPDGPAVLWYGLAGLWAVDALLALTPHMAVDQIDIVLMGGFGQPGWYIDFLSNSVYYWLYHARLAALLVTIEFVMQMVIALLLAVGRGRRVGRVALSLSLGWALVLWVMAEWMGNLWAGMSFWTGAPGSALLYALGAVVLLRPAWFRGRLAQVLGAAWGMGALLQALPAWWTGTTLATAMRANLVVTPVSWRTLPIQWLVGEATARPALVNGFLVALMVAVAGILVALRRPWTLWLVVVFLCLLWWWGENLGGLFGGIATDPNTGPVWILLVVSARFYTGSGRDADRHVEKVRGKGRWPACARF
ncbi:MAG: hypothetical protein M0Z54_13235 [Thermaerobacter sp.]|nr:hypothetical protein [Thermaerobacter sp.]